MSQGVAKLACYAVEGQYWINMSSRGAGANWSFQLTVLFQFKLSANILYLTPKSFPRRSSKLNRSFALFKMEGKAPQRWTSGTFVAGAPTQVFVLRSSTSGISSVTAHAPVPFLPSCCRGDACEPKMPAFTSPPTFGTRAAATILSISVPVLLEVSLSKGLLKHSQHLQLGIDDTG